MSYCIKKETANPSVISCRGFPSVKTCGLTNPYYKYIDFYYSTKLKRNINRCQLEDYWTEWLRRNIDLKPTKKVVGYYRKIIAYVKPMYVKFTQEQELHYSDLSVQCTAILLIKRCLSNIFMEDEASKIIELLGIESVCDC